MYNFILRLSRLTIFSLLIIIQFSFPIYAEVKSKSIDLTKGYEQEYVHKYSKAERIKKAYELRERLTDLGEAPSVFDHILTYGGASIGGLMTLGMVPLIYDSYANENPYALIGIGMLLVTAVPVLLTSTYFIYQNRQYDARYQLIQHEIQDYGIKRLPPPEKSWLFPLFEWSNTKGGVLFGILGFSSLIGYYSSIEEYESNRLPKGYLQRIAILGTVSSAISIYFFTRKSEPKHKFDDESILASSWVAPNLIDKDWVFSFGFSF